MLSLAVTNMCRHVQVRGLVDAYVKLCHAGKLDKPAA